MKRTITSNKRLYGLFGQLGIDTDTKGDLVNSITKGRTIHSSEMSDEEANRLIDILENNVQSRNRRHADLLQQMRRDVFKIMYDCGLLNGNMSTIEKMDIINAWIENKMNLKKDLNALEIDELTKLIKQLQAVRRKYVESKAKQAMFN
jgi:hypothetical protein